MLDLAKQLLILLTLLAEDAHAPEELKIEALEALAALFNCLTRVPGGSASLVETSAVPALGHAATTILEAISKGPSVEALSALDSMWSCIKDPQPLSTFLPATVSTLTKFLGRKLESRKKTTVFALTVLQRVLISLLSDVRTRNIRNETNPPARTENGEQKALTKSWLNATTAQIKLALSNVVRLRTNASEEVRSALSSFCLALLDECHETLSQSSPLLVETALTLTLVEEEQSSEHTTLPVLASIHPDIGDFIKNTVYNWVTSLPRIMQSNDEAGKQTILANLSQANGLISSLATGSPILEDTLLSSLRDSVTCILESSTPKGIQETTYNIDSQTMTTFASDHVLVSQFKPLLLPHDSQKQTREQLLSLLSSLGTRNQHVEMASELLEYARDASGTPQISSYWLAYQLSRTETFRNDNLDKFLDSSLTSSDQQSTMEQELFSYSVSLLTSDDGIHADWRVQAIALEVIADTAQRTKEDFRTELIDVLYPITQLLGSLSQDLREHAITCLNLLSSYCGYADTKTMIIENVDYMVNAVSLKLNTFDISPQAPQVLTMMIRLTGPSLLLYLDDVVDSIFAALDNFHGYQKLVEVLFSVLGEIVEVGSKSPQLQIESGQTANHRKQPPSFPSIENIISSIKTQSRRLNASESEELPLPHEDVPQRPWKQDSTASSILDTLEDPPDRKAEPDEPPTDLIPTPSKTQNLIHRITLLTQHHLTHSSPFLRTKLLSLLRTSLPLLSSHENTFLPLINDIWPVLLPRLYDPEPYVSITAAGAISAVCEGAGDFMASRFEQEWAGLMRWLGRCKVAMERERKSGKSRKGGAGRGEFALRWRVWEAGVGMLCRVLGNVRITEEMRDDVLALLGEEVERGDVRDVLESIEGGADGVWFELYLRGEVDLQELRRPQGLEGREFVDFAIEAS